MAKTLNKTNSTMVRRALAWLSGKTGKQPHRSYRVRLIVQSSFALICVLLGVEMARFTMAASAGELPLPPRPAGADGFLPLSGMMGALDWVHQGSLNSIHPAATVIFLLALGLAFFLRKSFCSWVCPIGFLSEILAKLGRLGFKYNYRPWRWIDVPLRSLKYLLFAFFAWGIFHMDAPQLAAFIDSPYNRVSDIKMGLFFVRLGTVGIGVLGGLVLWSVFIQGFWCRYLCPYGAVLGLFSWLSPVRVTRNADACTGCGICDTVCMARLPVATSDKILSPECTGCADCVSVCPKGGALRLSVGKRRIPILVYAAAIVGLFTAGYIAARAAGTWDNSITDREYIQRVQSIDTGEYGHPGVGGGR